MLTKAFVKRRKWQAGGKNGKICDLVVPVSCKDTENFDFHPSLTSSGLMSLLSRKIERNIFNFHTYIMGES
jgi:hypothetical protein